MKRIGLLSDTHGYFDEKINTYFAECDEIWHAGDIGDYKVIECLEKICPVVKGVYGNIDGQSIRKSFQKTLRFYCEQVDVLITHIGGYPNRYTPEIKNELYKNPPKLFICGHSHILKIIFDEKIKTLHINPGACGKSGFHQVKTLVRFVIDGYSIKDMEVIELGKRV
ncbi:MAG: metallophosphoesterase family protein [Flavobacteriales bacterium]|nr:metallophosphoesterase family protein [Flavobacteriales bacterium]